MRLYGMYCICKKNVNAVRKMTISTRQGNGGVYKYIDNWREISNVLKEVGKVYPLREYVREMYDAIPAIYQDQNKFDMSPNVADSFVEARKKLVSSMETIIRLYESTNLDKSGKAAYGFDVKMPKFEDLGEFSDCLKDLDFIVKHCPYLKGDGDIKFGSVDVGSIWLTFIVAGAAATKILINFGKIVDKAVKIKSHMITVRMQEEALHSVELKNEIAAEVLDAFKKTNKVITQNCVKELEKELGKLQDGEEEDKVGRCLEKMGYWMDKGMQIYSAIDSPSEVKDVFPAQEEVNFLSNDLMKLLETKSEE